MQAWSDLSSNGYISILIWNLNYYWSPNDPYTFPSNRFEWGINSFDMVAKKLVNRVHYYLFHQSSKYVKSSIIKIKQFLLYLVHAVEFGP